MRTLVNGVVKEYDPRTGRGKIISRAPIFGGGKQTFAFSREELDRDIDEKTLVGQTVEFRYVGMQTVNIGTEREPKFVQMPLPAEQIKLAKAKAKPVSTKPQASDKGQKPKLTKTRQPETPANQEQPVPKRNQKTRRVSGDEILTGVVKFFSGKGFGFIVRNDGEDDVFFHASAVQGFGSRDLNPQDLPDGTPVEFTLERDKRSGKIRAENIQILGKPKMPAKQKQDKPRRYHGVVARFNAKRGWGFIARDGDGEEIFVHQSEIAMEGFRELTPGQEVKFSVRETDKGPQALNVKVVGEGRAPKAKSKNTGVKGDKKEKREKRQKKANPSDMLVILNDVNEDERGRFFARILTRDEYGKPAKRTVIIESAHQDLTITKPGVRKALALRERFVELDSDQGGVLKIQIKFNDTQATVMFSLKGDEANPQRILFAKSVRTINRERQEQETA